MYDKIIWAACSDELLKIALSEKDAYFGEGLVEGAKRLALTEVPGTKPWVIGRKAAAEASERAALRASKGGGAVLRFNPNAGLHTASSTGGAAYRQAATRSAAAASRRGDALAAAMGGL